MAEKKLSRKKLLKEPDEFLTTTGTVVRYVKEHPRHVALAAAAVFAVFVVVAGFYYYQQQMNLASHNLFQGAVPGIRGGSQRKRGADPGETRHSPAGISVNSLTVSIEDCRRRSSVILRPCPL